MEQVTGPGWGDEVALEELLCPEFMRANTDFGSWEEMAAAGGIEWEGEGLGEAEVKAWNAFVRERTRFADWQAMQAEAGRAWWWWRRLRGNDDEIGMGWDG